MTDDPARLRAFPPQALPLPAEQGRLRANRGRRQWLAVAVLLLFPLPLPPALGGELLPLRPGSSLLLLPGLAVALYLFFHLQQCRTCNHRAGEDGRLFSFSYLGLADWITLGRGSGVVALAGFLPLAPETGRPLQASMHWVPGLVYSLISAADVLDGLIARKQGRETELGKRLDIAVDALGLLVGSLLAVLLGRLPAAYLLVGAAYYLYQFGLRQRRRRGLPVVALRPRPYARIVAGFQMGLVAVALLPVISPACAYIAAYVFMAPLLAGFVRDWLVVSCRLATDADQRSAWDAWAAAVWAAILPLLLRAFFLAVTAAAFAGALVFSESRVWQLASALCCLLMAAGLLGRTAGLALCLMLGAQQAPAAGLLPVFGLALVLVLTGAGPFSLWAPEELVLYRRKRGA